MEQADFVLCDLSDLNPNVLFELGIRTSLDRPVILVKDDLTERIPFDLNAINTLTYDSSLTPWSLVNEKPRLVNHVRSVMNSSNTGNSMWRYFGLTKRAMPSEAGGNPLEAKLDLLISEFSKLQSPVPVASQSTIRDFEGELARTVMSMENVDRYWINILDRAKGKIVLILESPDPSSVTFGQLAGLFEEARARGLDLDFQMRESSRLENG